MTTVECGIGLEKRLFLGLAESGNIDYFKQGDNIAKSADYTDSSRSACAGDCQGPCGLCGRGTSSSGVGIRPTIPKITANTPSLLETYVSTVGAEKVTSEERTLLTKLEGLDLDPIKVKLMDAEEGYGWTREQADSAANAYKQFLFISAKYDGSSIVPTKLVDKVWHYHILDTEKYAEDSQEVFGRFLHHFPYFGMRGEEDAANLKSSFAETQDLFVKEFGAPQLTSFDKKSEAAGYAYCREQGNCANMCEVW